MNNINSLWKFAVYNSLINITETIIRNSEKKEKFVTKLTTTLGNINIIDILNKESFENIVQEYAGIVNSTWYKFSKNINITKCFKAWWKKEYNIKLNTY